MMGGLQSDQSSSFKISGQRLQRFVGIVRRDPSVQTVVAFAGNNAAGGFLVVSLKPRNERKGGSVEVIQRLRPQLARVTGANLFLNPVQDVRVGGRNSNATYQYTLEGQDLASLRLWAGRLTEAMKTQPALVDVNSDQEDHGLETFVLIDRDNAARLGVTATAIDNTLYDAFGQRQVSTIYKETNQYHVVMEAAPAYTQDPTALQNIYVSTGSAATAAKSPATSGPATAAANSATASPTAATPSNVAGQPGRLGAGSGAALAVGATAVAGPAAPPGRAASQGVAVSAAAERVVPLAAFARWADAATPTAVNHQDSQPATTISFNLAPSKSLSDATKAIAQAQAEIGMPSTIHGGFQGTAKVFQQSLANEPILILAAIVAIYLVLGILYESYIHPLTVLSTLPSAGIGAVIALIVFKIEFTIIALIGVILLIGIVKKNAILMIDFALDAEREQGLTPRDAIRQAALTRFRPIMMTTFAAILGALPLAIGSGEGAELRRPLGVTVIGGLVVSQLITLLTTPVVYLYLDRARRRDDPFIRRRRLGGEPAPVT
jgi:multidrug efflux pump